MTTRKKQPVRKRKNPAKMLDFAGQAWYNIHRGSAWRRPDRLSGTDSAGNRHMPVWWNWQTHGT